MVNPMVKDIKQYVITVNHYWICLPVVLFLGTTKIVVAENVFFTSNWPSRNRENGMG